MAEIPPLCPLGPGGAPPSEVFRIETTDGRRLRAAVWRAPVPNRGLAIKFAGRTEFLEKLSIPAAQLVARGFDVAAVDWRGQGLSARLLEEPLKGHVGDFAEFQLDLHALLAAPQVAKLGPVRLVLAHSMGGAIALEALGSGLAPDAAILSAPMIGLTMSRPMRAAASVTGWIAARLGLGEKWPPFGDSRTPYVLTGFDDNVLTSDRDVWTWMESIARNHPEVTIAMPTMGWFSAAQAAMKRIGQAGALPCPALCVVGTEEKVVDPAAIRDAAPRLGFEVAEVEGARHEPLVEAEQARTATWHHIDRFLDTVPALAG